MAIELDLPRLRCFVVVAEELSFTRAAVRLHMAQPSVSSQIRKLEHDLGLELFVRSTRHVELTTSAEMLLPEARRLLAAAERTTAAVTSLLRAEQGELRVGSPVHLAMTLRYPIVTELIERWAPSVRVHNAPSVDLLPILQRGDLDVAFLNAPLPTGDAVTEIVEEGHFVVLVPREHELAQYEVIPLDALEGQRILSFGRHHNERLWDEKMATLISSGVQFVEVHEPAPSIMFRAAPAAGLPSLAFPWIAEWMGEPMGMVTRRIEGDPCGYTILLARRNARPSPRLAEFWEAVVAGSRESNRQSL